MIGGSVALVFCVLAGGAPLGSIWDAPSFVFVIMGSFFALFNGGSINDVMTMCKCIGRAFHAFNFNIGATIQILVSLAEKARREGILALEEGLDDINDEFLKSGIRLVVDGIDGDQVRTILENDMGQSEGRHISVVSMLNFWGGEGPGFGMMGTVIGLIGMLGNLDDKSSLGPNMAVALVTTLYGSMMVNWLLTPWSTKLLKQNGEEMTLKEVVVEGVLSSQKGDNPKILAQKLMTYLDPPTRRKLTAELLGE
jgi:chemotaxis protein MotA